MKTINDLIAKIEHVYDCLFINSSESLVKDTRYEEIIESDIRLKEIIMKSKFNAPEISNNILQRLIFKANDKKHPDHTNKIWKRLQLNKGMHFRIPGPLHEIYKESPKVYRSIQKAKTAVISSGTLINEEKDIIKVELKDERVLRKGYSLNNLIDVNYKSALQEEHKPDYISMVTDGFVRRKSLSVSSGFKQLKAYGFKAEPHIKIKAHEGTRRDSTFLYEL